MADASGELADSSRLLLEHTVPVEFNLTVDFEAWDMAVSSLVEIVAGLKQSFRWDTSDVQTSTTKGALLLDASSLQTELSRFDSSHVTTWAGSDDGDVNIVVGLPAGGGLETSTR